MENRLINPIEIRPIDFIPALSGLIGKTALVTSFAVIWASELNITNPDFIFENVRIEIIIGSIITLIAALLFPKIAPSGTLAPLIVLVPTMARFGVHPFQLSLFVGIIGIIGIKSSLFQKLLALSGVVSKTSLTLTFGISGLFLSLKNLNVFFKDRPTPFLLIIIILIMVYLLLKKWDKLWLIIPTAAIIAILVSLAYRITPGKINSIAVPSFHPSYWWNEMWGIGFGFDLLSIIKTLPFAFFVLLLWAIDTVSINMMLEASHTSDFKPEEPNLNHSFLITSFRNMIGGILGGAQTSALWRSFLIPLYMVKRPLRPASIIMGFFGIIAGFTALPIKLLSFPPLVWSVLLFGIFLPFISIGLKNLKNMQGLINKLVIIIAVVLGVFISPIITWLFAISYEKIFRKSINRL